MPLSEKTVLFPMALPYHLFHQLSDSDFMGLFLDSSVLLSCQSLCQGLLLVFQIDKAFLLLITPAQPWKWKEDCLIYCSITNHPKTSWLKTAINISYLFIIHIYPGFCESGIREQFRWVDMAQGLSQKFLPCTFLLSTA